MSRATAVIIKDAALTRFYALWTRSAVAALPRGLVIDDPGHGHDVICPLVPMGRDAGVHFDPRKDAEVMQHGPTADSGLRADDVFSRPELPQLGTGFAMIGVRFDKVAQEMTGCFARYRWLVEMQFRVPRDAGVLADTYAAAAAEILRTWKDPLPELDPVGVWPNTAGSGQADGEDTQPESATFRDEDQTWKIYTWVGGAEISYHTPVKLP